MAQIASRSPCIFIPTAIDLESFTEIHPQCLDYPDNTHADTQTEKLHPVEGHDRDRIVRIDPDLVLERHRSITSCKTELETRCSLGNFAYFPVKGREPVGAGVSLLFEMHGQYDERPTVTFPEAEYHRP